MASVASRSSLFESPLVPRSSQQWKGALQGVKLLYIQRQYKQCATRATELLEKAREPLHPVYKTYLYFYSAVCYEEMGRAAHKYSSTKVPLLQGALDRFDICNTVLPSPIPVSSRTSEESDFPSLGESSSPSEFSDSPSTVSSLVTSITDIIDRTIQWKEEDPFISDNDSCSDTDIVVVNKTVDDIAKHLLVPPPLTFRKSSDGIPQRTAVTRDSGHIAARSERPDRARLPPPLPIKIVPRTAIGKYKRTMDTSLSNRDSRLCTDDLLIDFSQKKGGPVALQYSDSIRRYNSSIRSLRSQIDSSMNSIHVLIDEVEEKQHTRKMAKNIKRSASFWSFSPIKGGDGCWEKVEVPKRSPGKETKQERIERLRNEGWKTVGLRSAARGWKGGEYYKAYCSSVLDELYLES